MLFDAPLVETEQNRSIRVEDLPEVAMAGRRRRQAEERLVPVETAGHIVDADDRPGTLHVFFRNLPFENGLTVQPVARRSNGINPSTERGSPRNPRHPER